MKLDEFTFSLALLAFPGIIVYMILKRVAPQRKESGFEAFLKIFVYSILSYLIYSILSWCYLHIQPLKDSGNPSTVQIFERDKIGTTEIFGATASAFLLSGIISYALTYNWLNKIFRMILASRRSGDKDLWTYYHNIPLEQKNGGWVFVRDHEKGIIYYGSVVGWSEEIDGNREIIIADAEIYIESENKETELLYESRVVYLSRKSENLSIEVPSTENHERK